MEIKPARRSLNKINNSVYSDTEVGAAAFLPATFIHNLFIIREPSITALLFGCSGRFAECVPLGFVQEKDGAGAVGGAGVGLAPGARFGMRGPRYLFWPPEQKGACASGAITRGRSIKQA